MYVKAQYVAKAQYVTILLRIGLSMWNLNQIFKNSAQYVAKIFIIVEFWFICNDLLFIAPPPSGKAWRQILITFSSNNWTQLPNG